MQNTILINKPLGLTPLQTIKIFKDQHPEYAEQTISFAGRLDPMAEGLLLLLIGEENKKRKQYEDMDKTYEFTMLLGIATDTYDLMGKITSTSFTFDSSVIKKQLELILPSYLGNITLPYPPYSSRTVNGKPLYWYARENKLSDITTPKRNVRIRELSLLSPHPQRSRVFEAGGPASFSSSSLLNFISQVIPEITGDFRQEEIVKLWTSKSSLFPPEIHLFSFKMRCSSGTYVRQIVHELGEKLGIPTVTYSIKRIKIGDYILEDALQILS